MLNEHAQALGRLNKGVAKTMTRAAIRQRKHAAKQPKRKRLRLKHANSPEIVSDPENIVEDLS